MTSEDLNEAVLAEDESSHLIQIQISGNPEPADLEKSAILSSQREDSSPIIQIQESEKSSKISESKGRRLASLEKISVSGISFSEKGIKKAEDAEMQVEEAGLAENAWEANEVIEVEAIEIKAEVNPEITEPSEPELIQRRIRRRPVYKKS